MEGAEIVGGAIANRSEGAVGLSNVFGPVLSDCARELRRRWPDRAVVGYGRRAELDELAPLGFRDLGALRVWIARS